MVLCLPLQKLVQTREITKPKVAQGNRYVRPCWSKSGPLSCVSVRHVLVKVDQVGRSRTCLAASEEEQKSEYAKDPRYLRLRIAL